MMILKPLLKDMIPMATTKPVLDFYSKNPKFYEIDGSSEITEITAKIDNFINV